MEKHFYLNEKELIALELLAKDGSYTAIKRDCGLSSVTLCNFLSKLRKKTGVTNTKDVEQVKNYLTQYQAVVTGTGPSDDQRNIIQRVLGVGFEPTTIQAIGHIKGQPTEHILAEYEAGIRAMGIFATSPRERRVQARLWLARRPIIIGGVERLTENHLKVLRMYADGFHDAEIRDTH
jgi:DNA-binding CsgD family transcriptional regulator